MKAKSEREALLPVFRVNSRNTCVLVLSCPLWTWKLSHSPEKGQFTNSAHQNKDLSLPSFFPSFLFHFPFFLSPFSFPLARSNWSTTEFRLCESHGFFKLLKAFEQSIDFRKLQPGLQELPRDGRHCLLGACLKSGARNQDRVTRKISSEENIWFKDIQRHLMPPGRERAEGMNPVS